mmetsp:Transcript_27650/g.50060  ORF Transcript_27650/g.50060 Transcript_27650/m.50060 type:complete len:80 (+) Transcript_27650:82-321(+)
MSCSRLYSFETVAWQVSCHYRVRVSIQTSTATVTILVQAANSPTCQTGIPPEIRCDKFRVSNGRSQRYDYGRKYLFLIG